MFIDLNGLKIALTAVLNSIGGKMDSINPTGTGNLSIDGNAWCSGDIRVGGTNYDDATVLVTQNTVNNVTSLVNGLNYSVNSLRVQVEENFIETTSTEIQALFN